MKLTAVFALLLSCFQSRAQSNFDTVIERSHIRLMVVAPVLQLGLQYEHKLTDELSLGAEGFVMMQAGLTGFESSNGKLTSAFYGYLGAPLRWYYATRRRLKKGHSIRNFTGFYLGAEPFVRSASFATIRQVRKNDGLSGAWINWGFQSEMKSRLTFGTQLGVAPAFVNLYPGPSRYDEPRIRLQFRFGWRLNDKQM